MSSNVRPGWRPRQRQATVLRRPRANIMVCTLLYLLKVRTWFWLTHYCSACSPSKRATQGVTDQLSYHHTDACGVSSMFVHSSKHKRRQRCGTMCLKTQALTSRYTVCAPYMLRHSRRSFETVTYYCERIHCDSRSACILPAEEEAVHRHAHLEHP